MHPQKLFPEYVLGIKSMQLLISSLTATMPLQLLSTFMIATKVSYKPFILICSLSAAEVLSLSNLMIPKLGILRAILTQVANALLTSALYLLFSVKQGLFKLYEEIAFTLLLIAFSLSLYSTGYHTSLSSPEFQALRSSQHG